MPEATEQKQRPPAGEEEQAPSRRVSGAVIGWSIAGLLLGIYFLWFCIQMAGHAVTGGATLVATFAAVGAGLAAGGLAFAFAKRLK